jgi:hypothetical protein
MCKNRENERDSFIGMLDLEKNNNYKMLTYDNNFKVHHMLGLWWFKFNKIEYPSKNKIFKIFWEFLFRYLFMAYIFKRSKFYLYKEQNNL